MKSLLARSGLAITLSVLLAAGFLPAAQAAHGAGIAAGTGENPLRMLASGADGAVFELNLPAPQVLDFEADGRPCQVLQASGFDELPVPGQPRLPIAGVWLGLPPGAPAEDWAVLEIESARLADLPGAYRLCPGAAPQLALDGGEPVSLGERAHWDAAAYAVDAFAPAAPAELATSGYVRSQRIGLVRFQPFQYNPARGQVRYYAHLRLRVRFMLAAAADLSLETPGSIEYAEGPFEAALRFQLANYAEARRWRVEAPPPDGLAQPGAGVAPAAPDAPRAGVAETRWQVIVAADGLYRVTYAQLLAANVPLAGLDPRTLRLTDHGSEVAIQVEGETDGSFGPGDALVFYGRAGQGRWTRRRVYWLSWGAGPGLRMARRGGAPVSGYPEVASFRDELRVEKNSEYLSSRPSGADSDRWYWNLLTASDTLASTQTFTYTYTFTPTHPLIDGEALLDVDLLGLGAAPEHHTRFRLNGAAVGVARWPADAIYTAGMALPQSLLRPGANTLEIVLPMDDVTFESFYLNGFDVSYRRRLQAVNDALAFGADAGQALFQIDGFSGTGPRVYDVTDPVAPVQIDGVAVSAASGAYWARFEASADAARRYLAAGPGAWRSADLRQAVLAGLAAPGNAADYILIAPPEFYPAAQALAVYRSAQGLRVRIVAPQQIYDEFGDGLVDPDAIRSFLAYAYAFWQRPAPVYVLLLGDGHFDPLDYKGLHAANWIPPYLADVDLWIGETAADNRYVSVAGADPLPDLALGRLPARSLDEAQAMVNKIVAYETTPASGDWKRRILFVADNKDSAGDFAALSDEIAGPYVAAPYRADRVYYGVNVSQASQATQAIVAALNSGRLLVSYVGHGAVRWWANEALFGRAQLPQLSNTGRLAVMLPMTCLDGYYIWPTSPAQDYSALSEALVALPDAGAVASFAPTGFGVATGHDVLERGFFQAALKDYVAEVGLAALQAKLYLFGATTGYADLVETYTLFGDPALRLPVARPQVEVRQQLASWLAPPGETLSFTLLLTNTGEMTATQALLTDVLPASWADLSTATFTASGVSAAARPGAPAFTWDLSDLAPGAVGRITVSVRTLPTAGPLVTNTATISAFGALPGPSSSHTARLPLNTFGVFLTYLAK